MYNPLRVFKFVRDAQAAGRAVVLVTIVATTGASARRPGTQLAVSEDGRYVGSLTGGCLETAIAAEALKALREGCAREVRFGEGSPYLDIRLPCGGGLDLLFNPITDNTLGDRLAVLLEGRRPVSLRLPRRDGPVAVTAEEQNTGFRAHPEAVVVGCCPTLRVALFGRGEAMDRLRDLCFAIDAEPVIHTPDADLLVRSTEAGARAIALVAPENQPAFDFDQFTAAVLLFHDHDWEPAILAHVLKSKAFYIGAMGSRTAHAARCDALRRLGVTAESLSRIEAPIGLIPAMRDPETLAVSILAQVVARFDEACP